MEVIKLSALENKALKLMEEGAYWLVWYNKNDYWKLSKVPEYTPVFSLVSVDHKTIRGFAYKTFKVFQKIGLLRCSSIEEGPSRRFGGRSPSKRYTLVDCIDLHTTKVTRKDSSK